MTPDKETVEFSNSTYINAKLYVPTGTKEKYMDAKGWKNFFNIIEIDIEKMWNGQGNPNDDSQSKEKCERPTINYANGKLSYTCATEGAICQSTITDTDISSFSGNEVQLTVTYTINVYATASGYENSDVVTATLCWIDADPKTEGIENSISQVRANAVLIQSHDGTLSIAGVADGTDIAVYSPSGQMVGIIGPTGSSKSSLVQLIPRLYDVTDGRVTVAGVDVRDFDLEYLRQQIGVVTQDSYLFNGTIRENLLYAKEDATAEEIEAACWIANLSDFIAAQPEGLDTMVGNRGLKLSGGEKQRLSIARVVLKDPRILILDEATSALDSITENAIQDALEALMEGRTSIVIAHRLSTILKADRILVVKDGVIAESGTHEELLEKGGVYRELYETQFRQILDMEKNS